MSLTNFSAGMTAISKTTTSGSQANVSLTVPSGFTDLNIVVRGGSTATGTALLLNMQFNSDTAAHYDVQYLQFSGTTTPTPVQTLATTAIPSGLLPGSTAAANSIGCSDILVFNYLNTSFFKMVSSQATSDGGSGSTNGGSYTGTWLSTAAITTILLYPATGNFLNGTTVSLYGIA
jgi:hypothetical protein